jgi:hypothetical protein
MPGKIDHRRMIDRLLAPRGGWRWFFAHCARLYRKLFFRREATMPPVLTYFVVYALVYLTVTRFAMVCVSMILRNYFRVNCERFEAIREKRNNYI